MKYSELSKDVQEKLDWHYKNHYLHRNCYKDFLYTASGKRIV